MHYIPKPSQNLKQLYEILQSPVIELNCKNPELNLTVIIDSLNNSKQCCVVITTNTSNRKVTKFKDLYNAKVLLKKMKELINKKSPTLRSRLIGVYPSISSPSCVYELHTYADTYVKNNILPSSNSELKRTMKFMAEKILGVSPSVGGLGLIIERGSLAFITNLLATTGLLDGISTKYSIACISTSRPIYLVFSETSDHPLYVVRKITDANGLQASHTDRHIYKLAGDLVPEPIGRYELSGESYDVQRGVKGTPWFQLKANIKAKKARSALEGRMWQALHHFQAKLCPNDSNTTSDLQPLNELYEAFSGYQCTNENINDGLASLMDQAVSALAQAPNCPAVPQHGDFCLNNLIIDTNHITVIDFEDFALTKMPLYDHFTLALSLPSCGDEPSKAARIFNHPTILMTANALDVPESTIRWHFLHHLLLRLGLWSRGEKRSRYRAWLKRVLDNFIDDHIKYSNTETVSSDFL